jgi:lipopolysaccharide/colanic/teichoic acid biosynthesis glycosyltransferase
VIDGFARHPVQARLKGMIDLALGAILLLLAAPVMLVTALWILVESGRPVLFVHPRAGKDGRPFAMFKFRSLVPDAVEVNRELALSEDPFGLVKDDPRFTRSGRFLRRTGIDELPQLLNVIRREMSIVGPRPDLVDQAAHYTEEDARRLSVRPGITGWSQIHGREDMTWPERFRFDAWYLEHWSLWLDAKIFVRTFGQLFRAEPVPVVDSMNIERSQRAREKTEA